MLRLMSLGQFNLAKENILGSISYGIDIVKSAKGRDCDPLHKQHELSFNQKLKKVREVAK